MSNKNYSFLGFETWKNNFRMFIKVHFSIFIMLLIIQLFICVCILFFMLDDSMLKVIKIYLKSIFTFNQNSMTTITLDGQRMTLSSAALTQKLSPYMEQILARFAKYAVWSFAIYILWIPIQYSFGRKAKQVKSEHMRGAVLLSPVELNRSMKEATFLPFGQVKMPTSAEVKHTLIIGRPGVGKTVCMSALLQAIIERGDRAIIHDFKGDYLQKFYRPDIDIIFNPLDQRSHYWNFFDEIESPMDVDAVGYALIPDAKGAGMDPFWNNAARDVFNGLVNHLILNDNKSYNALHALVTASSDMISDALRETPGSEAGATAVADPEAKQTGSILSVMTQYTKIFAYVREGSDVQSKKRFTINDWLSGKLKGNIFITNYSTMQDTLAPILTLMIDLMGRKLLSEKDDSKRRIFFMLDEFGALQKMQTITRLLTLARSKGGGVFLGIQDLGQIDKIYGKEHKQTIVNACGSSVVFSVADAETAEALSQTYGEYLSVDSYVSRSFGVESNKESLSMSEQKNKERIIMPSEISALPDLNCYIRFAGYPVTKTKLTYTHYPDRNEPLVTREDLKYQARSTVPKKDESTDEMDNINISDIF